MIFIYTHSITKCNNVCYFQDTGEKMYQSTVELLIERAKSDDCSISFYSKKQVITEFSYKEILDSALKVAKSLSLQGIGKNDKVALLLPTGIDFLASFFGAQLIGAIPIAVYPPVKIGKLDEWKETTTSLLDICEASILITNKMISHFSKEVAYKCQKDINELLVSQFSTTGLSIDEIEKPKSSDYCFFQFSSGTTGLPKPVMITHANTIANATAVATDIGYEAKGEVNVSWLPLYHDMGLIGGLFTPMLSGCSTVLLRPEVFLMNPFLWLKAISDTKARFTVAPNFAYGLCTKRIKESLLKDLDLSSLKVALCGAEIVQKHTIDKFIEKFSPVGFNSMALTPVYGMSETTLALAFSSTREEVIWKTFCKDSMERGYAVEADTGILLCSVGKAMTNHQIEIRNKDGETVLNGMTGLIYGKGPSVTDGYYKNSQATSEVINDGWLNTGDIGFVLDGELYICGREKEVIVINGRNYLASAIEETFNMMDGLRTGCSVVSGITYEGSDTEELIAIAEVADNKILSNENTMNSLISEIRKATNSAGFPLSAIQLVEKGSLPRTSSGKIKRRLSIQMWKENKLHYREKSKMAIWGLQMAKNLMMQLPKSKISTNNVSA